MRWFDFETVAQQAHLSAGQLGKLCALMRREFPSDEMLYELHVLRACLAIRDRLITVEQALAEQPEAAPAGSSAAQS
jgi:hypothetical protein